MRPALVLLACLPMVFTSCAASQNPLSNPKDAKADARLVGVWRGKLLGKDCYYHIARAGGKLPEGVLVLRGMSSRLDGEMQKSESTVLGFTTTLKESTYLNLTALKNDEYRELKENGWQPTRIGGYFIFKYTREKEVLKLRPMDLAAVEKAVRDEKIKGTLANETGPEPNVNPLANTLGDAIDDPARVKITDSSENLCRVIASEDSLFVKEDNDLTCVLKRVK